MMPDHPLCVVCGEARARYQGFCSPACQRVGKLMGMRATDLDCYSSQSEPTGDQWRTVAVGGKDYPVPVPVFLRLERAERDVRALHNRRDEIVKERNGLCDEIEILRAELHRITTQERLACPCSVPCPIHDGYTNALESGQTSAVSSTKGIAPRREVKIYCQGEGD